jgi:putative ATP-dependent endonuclease of OLD family
MHLRKLSLRNYRNFENTQLHFKKGVNTIIGENGSGKSNVLRALRLLLDDDMIRSAFRLESSDFHRGLSDWRGHWIIISAEFEEITTDEVVQALFAHATADVEEDDVERGCYTLIFRPKKEIRLKLAELEDEDHDGLAEIRSRITIADYETIFTGRSNADFNDDDTYHRLAGNFEECIFSEETDFPEIGAKISSLMSVSKQVSFTFVQALRDVVNEFRNNRTNPLLSLLKWRSGEVDADEFAAEFSDITQKVVELNRDIEAFEQVTEIRKDIRATVRRAVGEAFSPTSLSIRSDLPEDALRLFQSLKLFVGENDDTHEDSVEELSLGAANIIYLTLKLLEFKYRRAVDSIANFLLIEEPEAHIHNHIQKTLFDRITYKNTQIIYSTHSAQISEVSDIRRVNVLGKNGGRCVAFQPAAGLGSPEIKRVQRYLDAVRSNLLFARSVILVEGDAEEILIPILIKKVLGVSLDELSISLINIRSTGFENVALLFDDSRIQKKCAIVTDLDVATVDTTIREADSPTLKSKKRKAVRSQTVGARRQTRLTEFTEDNPWIEVFYANHTFEVGFVAAGNAVEAAALVSSVYSSASKIAAAEADLNSDSIADFGPRIVGMAEKMGKGWFAILLGGKLQFNTYIPQYILDAILFVHPSFTRGVWVNILTHRIKGMEQSGDFQEDVIRIMKRRVKEFGRGDIEFHQLREAIRENSDNDLIVPIMDRF